MNAVKMLTPTNFTKIESDAKCALPDGTDFELIQYRNPVNSAVMVVRAGTFR